MTKRTPPPDGTRTTAGRDLKGRFRPGVSGNPSRRFPPGTSGNPTGRPKTFSIRQLVAEALSDTNVWKEAVERYQETLKARKSVISGLEFAARVNREVGLGSGETPAGGVAIIFQSNIRPAKLARRKGVA